MVLLVLRCDSSVFCKPGSNCEPQQDVLFTLNDESSGSCFKMKFVFSLFFSGIYDFNPGNLKKLYKCVKIVQLTPVFSIAGLPQ